MQGLKWFKICDVINQNQIRMQGKSRSKNSKDFFYRQDKESFYCQWKKCLLSTIFRVKNVSRNRTYLYLRSTTVYLLYVWLQASQTHDSRNRSNLNNLYTCIAEWDVTAYSAWCCVMYVCIYIPHISLIVSWRFTNLLGEIESQFVKVPL